MFTLMFTHKKQKIPNSIIPKELGISYAPRIGFDNYNNNNLSLQFVVIYFYFLYYMVAKHHNYWHLPPHLFTQLFTRTHSNSNWHGISKSSPANGQKT